MPAVATLFPTVAKVKTSPIDPEFLKVEHNVPPPVRRMSAHGKYHQHLTLMRPGSCIRCEPKELNSISGAVRKAIAAGKYPHLKDCKVVAMQCPDGHGRVWTLKEET